MKKSGYVSQALAIEIAEKAGFKLVSSSEINANPKDTKDHPRGVWTLLPNLRLGEKDKDKYTAIGESDRMTLFFVKD
jgi:predicted methyltransferase